MSHQDRPVVGLLPAFTGKCKAAHTGAGYPATPPLFRAPPSMAVSAHRAQGSRRSLRPSPAPSDLHFYVERSSSTRAAVLRVLLPPVSSGENPSNRILRFRGLSLQSLHRRSSVWTRHCMAPSRSAVFRSRARVVACCWSEVQPAFI